ncbi:enoyl-CoA hydratase/isomerase family protein [Luteococcus sp. Sow4_B9]|uniref:enoyl-CoA hydratase/isomerase family protein n=1 Tax=Luteococcus sp. Sow4_B9 TaxID=3438792 RepID=UPI003F9E0409
MPEQVRVEIDAGIAQVVLCAPESGNRVDVGFGKDLERALDRVADADGVRVVWLRAEGDHFSQGGDLRPFHERIEELGTRMPGLFDAFNPALEKLGSLPVPSVAEVRGWCVGGALGMVSLADVVVAGSSARLRPAFPGLGISNAGGSTVGFASRMGVSRAKRFCMLNELLDAEQAQQVGLVDFVVGDELLKESAGEIVSRLASGPTLSFAGMRRNFGRLGMELGEALAMEVENISVCAASADAAEAVTAFMEKRPAQMRGR